MHTITGDLLRALEGPDSCGAPRLITVSSEGHCIICYQGGPGQGHFCTFSINGKLLASLELADSTRVGQGWANLLLLLLFITYYLFPTPNTNLKGWVWDLRNASRF